MPRLGALTFLVVTLISIPAFGQDNCPPASWVQAVNLSRDAKSLLDDRRFEEALVKLREAYGICPEPVLQRSIAKVQEDAGHLEDSVASFQACAAHSADEAVRAECSQRAAALEDRLSSATLLVETNANSASMEIDAEAPRPCGQAIMVKPGRHTLRVQAEGRVPYVTELDVRGGRETRLTVDLKEAPAAPVGQLESAQGPVGNPGVAGQSRPSSNDTIMVAAPAFSPEASWNWVGIGTSTVALGVGVAFLIQYGIDKSNARSARWDPELQGWWEADSVSSRNLIVGACLATAGIAGGLTSWLLWPELPLRPGVAATQGGGLIGVTVGL